MATLRLLFGLLLGALLVSATAIAVPMHGTYTIGDDPEDSYASFTLAVAALTANQVDGAVIFDVEELTYSSGSVAIGQITGASATNTITFRDAGALDTPPLISANATPAVNLNGADYITFDGINITLTAAGKVVQITGNADYNAIKNCVLTGGLETANTNYGVSITGGGNDYNVIENVTVNRTAYYPVHLVGAVGATDQGNEVRTCTLIGGVWGVFLNYQNRAVVRNCDIQPGYDGLMLESKGIYVASQVAGELSTAYGNKIHNIRSGGGIAYGIHATPGAGGLFKAYNNFVYDFQLTGVGALYGFRVASGTVELYFNSVYIGDVGTSGATNGFYQSSTSTVVLLKNNIFQIAEPTNTRWAINRNGGTLTSDYNCVYGTGIGYNMGRDGTTAYATLALWQAGTPYDDNSREGNPGFIGPTDLHIDSAYVLVNSAGTPIDGITNDIDGEGRGSPPDIGADEYTPGLRDFRVIGFVGLLPEYVSQTLYTIQADVQNNGNVNGTNIPVRLYYDGVLQSTLLVTLATGIRDTIDFAWTTPDTSYEVDTLEVQAFWPNDAIPANDSALANVTVRRPPAAVDSLTVYADSLGSDAVLNWAPAAGANSYKVYRGNDYYFVLDGTTYIGATAATSYTDVGVLATTGEKYYVVLASTDVIARGR